MADLLTMSDAELAQLSADVLAERERRALLRQAAQQAAALADQFAEAVQDEPPVGGASIPDAIGPGRRITWTDGNVYRNTSGAFLPKTAHPGVYPQGWAQETGLPATVPAWKAGENVKAGDLRTHAGIVYRCIQGHDTLTGWEPPATPALWTPQGA